MKDHARLSWLSGTASRQVPSFLLSDNQPDFHAMTRLVDNPWSLEDWDSVTEDDYNRRIVVSTYEKGRTYLLRKIRDDLSSMSVPLRGSLQAAFPTYYEYFVSKWARKNRNISHIGGHHCPTPSSHTRSFLLPQPDTHTFHHGLTLYLLRPYYQLHSPYLVAEHASTPSIVLYDHSTTSTLYSHG